MKLRYILSGYSGCAFMRDSHSSKCKDTGRQNSIFKRICTRCSVLFWNVIRTPHSKRCLTEGNPSCHIFSLGLTLQCSIDYCVGVSFPKSMYLKLKFPIITCNWMESLWKVTKIRFGHKVQTPHPPPSMINDFSKSSVCCVLPCDAHFHVML